MLLYLHIISSSLWLGTAATLPFWGNRMNRADHLHTVLNIIDTVFILKCVYIMGGLLLTLGTGVLLAQQSGLALLSFDQLPAWLFSALTVSFIIFVNSWIIFYFMLSGRRGKRSLMRLVPPIGYTNIGLILLVFFLMVFKPAGKSLFQALSIFLIPIVIANLLNISIRLAKRVKLKGLSAERFADYYFRLINEEKMTDLFKLFHDDAKFIDPFATGPINGILAIERFFQQLGDQFDSIRIIPQNLSVNSEDIHIHWKAQGITKNGLKMESLFGTNNLTKRKRKIIKVNIDFNLDDLPQIQRVTV